MVELYGPCYSSEYSTVDLDGMSDCDSEWVGRMSMVPIVCDGMIPITLGFVD